MDGGEVFAFTLKVVPTRIKNTLEDAGLDSGAIDAFLLHQANRFMIRHIGKRIGADEAQLPINIDRYGNTSSATLPLLLADNMAGRLKVGPAKLLLAGFGVGLSWGAVLGDIGPLHCAEVVSA
jgi:3-oxoacyl-[acyl-carrier-protein] synthase-3